MSEKVLMKGNHAIAEAAVRAGLEFFAGYPITPSTEVLEHLSKRLPEEGRVFIQAENEIAAINMIAGAYGTGHRAMTASSGPGISLKLEGMSYAASAEVPFVCVNVNRAGRGIGSLDGGQDGYIQCIRSGGHGDYRNLVYTPATVQEAADDTYEAFDMAEKYRIGVFILLDTALGQTMEPVELPPYKTRQVPLDWGVDGTNTVGLKRNKFQLDANSEHWIEKVATVQNEMQRWESHYVEDADYVFVSFGIAGRVCLEAVEQLRACGERVGLIRPRLVFPFPERAFDAVPLSVKGFISVEGTDLGQMVDDVALTVKRKFQRNIPVYCNAYRRGVPTEDKIIEHYRGVKSGTVKEAY